MFVCNELRAEVWQPDFSSSGQASPLWTRVFCRETQITNSLEWVEWLDNPVQVALCDACGYNGCASGGYVHVSRLAHLVLWSPPQPDDADGAAGDDYETSHVIRALGALAIPATVWNAWAEAIPDVPPAERLVPANYAAVADAWIAGPGRSTEAILERARERLVGGDTLEKSRAIELLEKVVDGMSRRRDETFRQPLITPGDAGAHIETLYFDGPRETDWPAFAFAGADPYIVLDQQHITRAPT